MPGFGSIAPGQDDENTLLDDWQEREAQENLAANRPSGLSTIWQAIKHPSLYPMYKALTTPQEVPQAGADTSNLPDVGAPLIPSGPQVSAGTGIGNALTSNLSQAAYGTVKSGLTAPGEALSGELPMYGPSGTLNEDMIRRALDISALAGGASVAGTTERLPARLLSDTGKPAAAAAIAEHAPPFATGAEDALARVPSKELSGPQWLNQMKRFGAKPEELDWRGATEALQGQGAKVPREAVEQQLANNPVELKPIVKGGREWEELSAERQDYGDPLPGVQRPEYAQYTIPGGENYRERLMQVPQNEPKSFGVFTRTGERLMPDMEWDTADEAAHWAGEARYPNAMREALIPRDAWVRQISGKDYKGPHWDEPNVVFHRRSTDRDFTEPLTPQQQSDIQTRANYGDVLDAIRDSQSDAIRQINDERGRLNFINRDQIRADYAAGRIDREGMEERYNSLSSPEMVAAQNRLQELRRQEDSIRRQMPEEPQQTSIRSLHDEENQSDWHQQGREKGYGDPDTLIDKFAGGQPRIEPQPTGGGLWRVYWPDGTFSGGYGSQEEATMAANQRRYEKAGYVPDAPFKGTGWERLAAHDQLREAAEKGYPRISWTAGQESPTNPLVMLREGQRRLEELSPKQQQEVIQADKGLKDYYNRRRVDQINKMGKPYGAQVQQGTLPLKGGLSGRAAMDRAGIHPMHQEDFWENLNEYRDPALVPSGEFEGQRMTRDQFFDAVRQKGVPAYYMDIPEAMRRDLLSKPASLFEKPGEVAALPAVGARMQSQDQARARRQAFRSLIENSR